MKTHHVDYYETYSRTYEVEAESPEEAEEKVLKGIGEGSYPPPEECVRSWWTTQNFEEESADFFKKLTNNEKRKEMYMESLTQDTLTVLEKLDIKDFQKSRKENAKFSMFARGKLQKALIDALNWQGFDFVEVVPDYTSQVCPVCGYLDSENRDGKNFICKCCGYQDDADHVGALNIRSRATDQEILELGERYRYAKKTLQRKLKTLLMNRHQEYVQQNC